MSDIVAFDLFLERVEYIEPFAGRWLIEIDDRPVTLAACGIIGEFVVDQPLCRGRLPDGRGKLEKGLIGRREAGPFHGRSCDGFRGRKPLREHDGGQLCAKDGDHYKRQEREVENRPSKIR